MSDWADEQAAALTLHWVRGMSAKPDEIRTLNWLDELIADALRSERAKQDKMREAWNMLLEFSRHKDKCLIYPLMVSFDPDNCSCGYEQALAKWREATE